MKRKLKNLSMLFCCLSLTMMSCGKRNYFPDPDDRGLSRLTSRGYNIITMYINNVPYINPYRRPLFGGISNTLPTITTKITNNDSVTLQISWQIEINDTSVSTSRITLFLFWFRFQKALALMISFRWMDNGFHLAPTELLSIIRIIIWTRWPENLIFILSI